MTTMSLQPNLLTKHYPPSSSEGLVTRSFYCQGIGLLNVMLGVNGQQRVGQSVHSLYCHFSISQQSIAVKSMAPESVRVALPTRHRIVILHDKQTNYTNTFLSPDIPFSPHANAQPLNQANLGRFSIAYDRTISTTMDNLERTVDFTVRIGKQLSFQGGEAGAISRNQYYLFIFSEVHAVEYTDEATLAHPIVTYRHVYTE